MKCSSRGINCSKRGLIFGLNYTFKVLPPGFYFITVKIVDTIGQPIIDQYIIFKVVFNCEIGQDCEELNVEYFSKFKNLIKSILENEKMNKNDQKIKIFEIFGNLTENLSSEPNFNSEILLGFLGVNVCLVFDNKKND